MHTSFDQETNRSHSLSVKWNRDAIKSHCGNADAKPFWVADMDFKVAPQIQQAATIAAGEGIYGYPHFDGVKEAFCTFASKRHGYPFKAEMTVTFPGVLVSVSMLMQLLTKAGEGVIVPLPAYRPFLDITRDLGRTLLPWPMQYDEKAHRFSLDWNTFDQLASQARMVLFCSPQNPSGDVFSADELHLLASKAETHHLAVVCDEIHADLSYTKHTSMVSIADHHNIPCAVCMAPSKTFNVAGEHFSVVVTKDATLKNQLETLKKQNRIEETSFFSTTVAIASYRYGYEWLMELLPYLKENANLIERYLQEHCPLLSFVKPNASFIGLIDCNKALPLIEADASANPDLYNPRQSPDGGLASRFFGIRAGVCCNDGTWFGSDAYKGFVRFNYGASRKNVMTAITKMADAVNLLAKS